MPLPPNSAITLQGHSALTSKPKVAMIVRMTEETLDALANLTATDRMDFEFGDRPVRRSSLFCQTWLLQC